MFSPLCSSYALVNLCAFSDSFLLFHSVVISGVFPLNTTHFFRECFLVVLTFINPFIMAVGAVVECNALLYPRSSSERRRLQL